MTDNALSALLLSDIAAIRTPEALKTWGIRWADEIQATGERDRIAEAYQQRLTNLANSE